MGVAADDEVPTGWAYSIGLWHTLRSPEICVFGLAVDTMMSLINEAGEAVRNGMPARMPSWSGVPEPGRGVRGRPETCRPVTKQFRLHHGGQGRHQRGTLTSPIS
jgi:hypothetical protein